MATKHSSRSRGSRVRISPQTAALALLLASACGGDDTGGGDVGGDASDSNILFPTDVAPDTTSLFDVGTTQATDTAAPVDTTPPQDTQPPGCVDGAGCNDNDPCTNNDQCVSGQCVGTPLDCNDGVPCTTDQCAGGICRHTVNAGACHIAGTCWTSDQPNPANSCQKCSPAQDDEAWTGLVGVKCEDGNACTDGEACTAAGTCEGGVAPAEVCDDSVDNDCDGDTDAEDDACAVETGCTYHNDCYPERVCALWRATGTLECSDPCAGPADCPVGQICSKAPGSAQVGYCEPPNTALLANGSQCSDDAQCQSRMCTGTCVDTCLDELSCPGNPSPTCQLVGDLSIGFISGACAANAPGTLALGAVCGTGDGNYDASLCASGHCDLLAAVPTCAPLCTTEADCLPEQECNIVLRANGPNASTVPYHPQFSQATYDTATGCYTPPAYGNLNVGVQCTHPSQCTSYKCLALIPGDDRMFCTTYCSVDADCPEGLTCKLEAITLASAWLQAAGTALPGARSLVRVCKFN